MAGLRSGFVAGDRALVTYLGEVRKHGGLMMPAPVQAATVAALGDDERVAEQRARYARRRAMPGGWCTTAARPPSTCGCATSTGAVTAGRSPTTSPPPAWWSRRATS